jgi:hypothetical protein
MLQASQAKAQAAQQKEAEDFERMRTQNLQLMQAQQIVNRERGAEFDRQSQVAEQTAKLSKSLGLERDSYDNAMLEEIARVGDLEGLNSLQASAVAKAQKEKEDQLKLAEIQGKLGSAELGARGRIYAADKGLEGRKFAATAGKEGRLGAARIAADAKRYGADKSAEGRKAAQEAREKNYLFEAVKTGLTSMGDISQVTNPEAYNQQKQLFMAIGTDLQSGMPMDQIKKKYGVLLDLHFKMPMPGDEPGTEDDGFDPSDPGFGDE